MSKTNDIILGIDLGTTTSEAAIIKKGREKMIIDGDGNDLIASVVGINPKTKKLIVGNKAAGVANGQTKYFITEVKREMGKQKKLTIGDQTLTPTEVSAEILKYIKNLAEEQVGEKIKSAVITVPANFNNKQIDATQKAGKLAGFTVERVIKEPTAAALAYCVDNTEDDDFIKLMIYDLGGGTFDVSIGEFQGGMNVLDIKSSAGDMNLGGKDFDRALADYIFEDFEKEYGISLKDEPDTEWRVLEAAETVKKELSFSTETTLNLPFIASKSGKPISYTKDITRKEFESLISEKIDNTAKAIDKALKGAKLKRNDIDMVLLVGGSTRIPYVQNFVKEEMGDIIKKDIDPDRAVAIGAAHQASILSGKSDAVIMDVVPLSMGTSVTSEINGQLIHGLYSEVLPAQTPYSKESEPKQYFMVLDNQEVVNIEVFQKNDIENDSMWAADHTLIGNKRVDGIPPAEAGKESITLTYCYNLDGKLDVKVVIDSIDKEEIFQVSTNDNGSIKDAEYEDEPSTPDLSEWEKSALAKEYKSTIQIAEKRLKDKSHKKLESILNDLKIGIIDNDKTKSEDLADEINDLLFDLDN